MSGFEGNPDLDWTKDFIGHGTHCSGTIAAAKNGIGVVGVAPDADIYSISVFNRRGGFAYGSSILSAVQQCVDAGSNIVSMSLGGPLPNIFEWFAYQNLLDDGVICIAAAGYVRQQARQPSTMISSLNLTLSCVVFAAVIRGIAYHRTRPRTLVLFLLLLSTKTWKRQISRREIETLTLQHQA